MKRIYNYKDTNPLAEFYNNLLETNKMIRINNWRVLSEITGLPVQTLISVARKKEEAILKITLGTYLKIKNSTGIDLLSFNKEKK